jgi:hypothetical protein
MDIGYNYVLSISNKQLLKPINPINLPIELS